MTSVQFIAIAGCGGHQLVVDGQVVEFCAQHWRPATVRRNDYGRLIFVCNGAVGNALDISHSTALDLHPITDWSELHPLLGAPA